MKNLNGFIIAAMAIALTASCTGKLENEIKADANTNCPEISELASMTFSAFNGEEVVDTRTTYRSRNVYWEATDIISVFSVAETVTKTDFTVSSLSEDKKEASFTGMGNTNAEVYYAVYPHAEANAYDNGTFTVNIPTEQVGVREGFASNSNVSVAVAGKGGTLQFKNLSSVIFFKFDNTADAANTKSVTIKARKSEDGAESPEFWGLTGNVTFTLDAKGIPVVSEGSVDYVTLNAPKGGFVPGVNYIIPVCPVGECKGMQVVFEDLNGDKYVKNNDTDLKLQRNTMFNNNAVKKPFDGHALPEEFTVTLDFATSWPFNEPCKDASNQASAQQDIYTFNYNYQLDGVDKTLVLESGLLWGVYSKDQGYEYKNNVGLIFNVPSGSNNCGGLVKLPVVPGRCVKSVEVEHNSGASKVFHLVAGFKQVPVQIITGSAVESEVVYEFPVTHNNIVYGQTPGEVFCIRCRSESTKLTRLTITYTKPDQE